MKKEDEKNIWSAFGFLSIMMVIIFVINIFTNIKVTNLIYKIENMRMEQSK